MIFQPNGCGPKGLQRFIPNGPFKRACDLHDLDFHIKVKTYWETNNDFLRKMWKSSTRWYHYPWAIVYYIAVVLFGWIWWNHAKRYKSTEV